MANTKNIQDRGERKTAKRAQRKSLKQTFHNLSPKEKTQFRKSETAGLRKWIGEQQGDDSDE